MTPDRGELDNQDTIIYLTARTSELDKDSEDIRT